MSIFLFWILFSIAVGILASNRGRSGIAWFFLSLLISPLLGLIFVLVTKNLAKEQEKEEEEKLKEVKYAGVQTLSNDSYKIYLTKKYNIEKNDVLSKFICSDKLFDTVDDALTYAMQIDAKSSEIKPSTINLDGSITCAKCGGANTNNEIDCRYCKYPLRFQ
jgi:hypothetical protein